MEQRDDEITDVMDTLSELAPTAADAPRPASHALARLRQQLEPRPQQPTFGRLTLMFRRKYALATLFVFLLLVAALSFPGVRAAASDFLGLFRVQKFTPISISPEQLALLEELADSGLQPGEIELIDDPGEPQEVGSLEEAENIAGRQARSPGILGEPDTVYASDGGSGRLIIDVASARAILSAAGADPNLVPDSLDGAAVNITIFPSVSQDWSDGTTLMQSLSPLVEYPEDVDVAALGEALLQALGMDRRRASRLAQEIDWTNTLLLPVPEGVATVSEVEIDDAYGLALSSLEGQDSVIIWQRDGIVYNLRGTTDLAELVAIGNSLD